MTGKLVLAGLRPETTPLADWCAAVFATLVDAAQGIEADKIEDFGDKLAEPLPGDERDDLDPDTWGTSDEAQEAHSRLLAAFGQPAQAE